LVLIFSVGSFYFLFYLMSMFQIFETFGYFLEMTSFPLFHIANVLFALVTFPIESFFYFIKTDYTEAKEKIERSKKKREKRRFTKGLDAS
jgi:hypothetical protein